MYNFFPGLIVGAIILQVAIIAPSMFRTLDMDNFGKAIRAIWPKFFAMIAVLGVLSFAVVYLNGELSIYHSVIAISSVILASICYAIIPATNRATDNGDHKTFKILHRISVSFTIILLIINIAFPFLP
ncbi:MAG: hypothetical protein CMB63_07130 [Euryarchaeota archaeon]|nr:hypothetical protein [Euryarchaeota archaeon]|tara:strand:- start:156 stop:539 length:384 start_codon:yes stop_codon:yes gene_type:complete